MKKQSNGEKNEARLRYRFRQLQRAGKIPKDMTMKQFRGSEFNAFITKTIALKNQKKDIVIRIIKVYVDMSRFLDVKGRVPKVIKVPVSKRQRRKDRRELKNKALRYIQQEQIVRKQVTDCRNAVAYAKKIIKVGKANADLLPDDKEFKVILGKIPRKKKKEKKANDRFMLALKKGIV